MSHFDLIRQWATDRNIIEGATPQAQFVKLIEEAGELAAGLAKSRREVVIDSIGDMAVVLTILAAQSGVTIEECIAAAYEEIKDRKGRMIDGTFVKESDLAVPKVGDLIEVTCNDGNEKYYSVGARAELIRYSGADVWLAEFTDGSGWWIPTGNFKVISPR